MSKFSLPTETVELPSKGLLYPESSPLKKGTVEMKYMTAREEDILTNNNYIQAGTAIDRAIQSLIVDKSINYDELLVGDKNALMVAARILAYGKDYPIYWDGKPYTVDLSKLAGLKPAAVMCEIVKDDGTMARRPDLEKFALENNIGVEAESYATAKEFNEATKNFNFDKNIKGKIGNFKISDNKIIQELNIYKLEDGKFIQNKF